MSWSESLATALIVTEWSMGSGCVELTVTVGDQFGSAGLLMSTAPHEAIRSVAWSPLRSDVFSETTVFLKRSLVSLLWSPSEKLDAAPNVPSPLPGRIETLSQF